MSILKRAFSLLRRHSGVVNLLRNTTHLARNRRVSPGAWLLNDGTLRFGYRAIISRGCQLSIPSGAVLELGDHVWLNRDVQIDVLGKISIGPHTTVQRSCTFVGDIAIGCGCLFAPNVFISSGQHYFDIWPAVPIRVQEARVEADDALRTRHSRAVRIGDDCWIGTNVVILPGVTVGRGAVIGANAVVAKDVLPYEVVAGAPARRLRMRLEFTPPLHLDGANEAHLPYFYSGFEFGSANPPVANGDFVLALSLSHATAVRVTLRGVSTARLQVAARAERELVREGETREIVVPVAPGSGSEVDRLRIGLPEGGRVGVLRAEVVTDAAFTSLPHQS